MMDYSSKKVLKKQPRGKKTHKHERKFIFKKVLTVLSLAIVLFALASLGAYYAYPLMNTLKGAVTLKVKDVVVTGNKILDKREVIKQAGITPDTNLMKIELGKLKKRLYKNPFIKDVSVARSLPDKLQITVVERQPHAILEENGLWYIGTDGKPFKKVNPSGGESINYPVITGVPKNTQEAASYRNSVLSEALTILDKLMSWGIAKGENISEVNYCEIYGFSVYIGKRAYRVIMGFKDIDEKLRRLKMIIKRLKNNRAIALIDLDYEEKAVVKLKRAI